MCYCRKCDWDYEEGNECLCPFYRKFMEGGETNSVPMAWKLDYWDGYPNAVKYCDHSDEFVASGGTKHCKLCGRSDSSNTKYGRMSDTELIRRIEQAPDFGYDDEEVALTESLDRQGKRWRWRGRDIEIY